MPRALLGLCSYGACAVLLTWPLLANFDGAVLAHWDKDVTDALWSIWWFGVAIASPERGLFHTDLLHYPFGVSLQYGDLNLAVVAPAWLLSRAVGLVAAYNLVLLASFVVAAALMARLVRAVCGDRGAAWLAGLMYAGAPYWVASACNGWIFYAQTWALPAALLAILNAARRGTLAAWAWAGAALGLAFHVHPYYFLYAVVLLPLLALLHADRVFAAVRAARGAGGAGAGRGPLLAIAVMLAVVAPRAWPMLAASGAEWLSHSSPLNTALAARPLEFVWPCRADVTARVAHVGYLVPYLGWTMSAAALAALWLRRTRREALRWLAAAAAMLVLALGPLAADGAASLRLPGYWLQQLPGFRFMTNHWRWSLPAVLCLCVTASLGVAALRQRWWPRALAVAFLAEALLVVPLPVAKPLLDAAPRPAALLLRDQPAVHAVLDLGPAAKLNQIVHGRPIVGGWVARLDAAAAAKTDELVRGFFALGDLQSAYGYLAARGIDGVITNDGQAVVIERGADGRWLGRVLRD